MKLLILGSNGLLGNTLIKYFFEKNNYETYGFLRDSSKLKFFKRKYTSRLIIIQDILDINNLRKKIKELMPDVIINCIGQTNKISEQKFNNIEKYINLNSLFPFRLKEICVEIKSRLIHFSSDCVFSGKKGFYSEKDNP
ncbi:NAD(P)-dependent oxidoreductase, partial [bacterium]|nr:NAD(P)-dependent oxidoreductase [bacterium]